MVSYDFEMPTPDPYEMRGERSVAWQELLEDFWRSGCDYARRGSGTIRQLSGEFAQPRGGQVPWAGMAGDAELPKTKTLRLMRATDTAVRRVACSPCAVPARLRVFGWP
jgi:hypothetical protein